MSQLPYLQLTLTLYPYRLRHLATVTFAKLHIIDNLYFWQLKLLADIYTRFCDDKFKASAASIHQKRAWLSVISAPCLVIKGVAADPHFWQNDFYQKSNHH